MVLGQMPMGQKPIPPVNIPLPTKPDSNGWRIHLPQNGIPLALGQSFWYQVLIPREGPRLFGSGAEELQRAKDPEDLHDPAQAHQAQEGEVHPAAGGLRGSIVSARGEGNVRKPVRNP